MFPFAFAQLLYAATEFVCANSKELRRAVPGRPCGFLPVETQIERACFHWRRRARLFAVVFLALVAANATAQEHWAFKPIRRPEIPLINARWNTHNAIDHFVQQRLLSAGMDPSQQANRVTLIRRVSLDLIGMPPTPSEVRSFVEDPRPDAYERLVDRLLASPHYGERWARPWLDLCHYADTDGYLTDQQRPVAWRYRDWLVQALNDNRRFDQFTVEQLAGDLLPGATMEQRIATGFLRQTLSNREGGADLEEFRVKQVVDRTQMVGTIWLGLTVHCAQCHDHKYDPVSQDEFFQLYACFNNADEVNVDAPLPSERVGFLWTRSEYHNQRQALIDPIRSQLQELQRAWEAKLMVAWKNPGLDSHWDRQWELLGLVWGGNLGEGQLEGVEIVKLPWPKRTARQQDDLLDFFLPRVSGFNAAKAKELKIAALRDSLQSLKKEAPAATRAAVIRAAQTLRVNYVHERGEFRDHGKEVAPGVPDCLPPWSPKPGEDQRLTLARWLFDKQNPLTARVTINRMWQQFFGRGLVVTTEDFGTRGAAPSHPKLLDWLASEFIRTKWDVKVMHRLIVTSATYRQSSSPRSDLSKRDPNNVLLARQNSLRVPAETVRDIGLCVSGLLYPKLGGPSVKPSQPKRVTMEAFGLNDWRPSPAPDRYRRGLYTFVIRTAPFAQAAIFDSPNPNQTCTRRVRSNTPLQALTLLNDPVFFEMAQAMAIRILNQELTSDTQRIDFAFRLCMARMPTEAEHQRLATFLAGQQDLFSHDPQAVKSILGSQANEKLNHSRQAAWTNLCSVLLNLHEFITRD